MARMLPVGDATELGTIDPVAAQNPIDPASLRNPNVGVAGSPQAQAFRAAGAGAATDATPAAGGLRSGAYTQAVRATGAMRKVANVAGRVAAPLALGATAGAVAGTDTGEYEKRFGFDPGGSDGTVGGFARDLGIRTLGAASDLGNALTGGTAGKYLFRDKQPDESLTAGATPPTGATSTIPGADGSANAEGAYPSSITAPAGIRQTPDGTFTNVADQTDFNQHPGTVSTIQGSGLRASNADVVGAAKSLDAYGPGAHNADGSTGFASDLGSGGNNGVNSDHNRNFNADLTAERADAAIRLGGHNGPAQANAINAGLRDRTGNISAENIARLHESGETMRAVAANKTQQAIHEAANAVSLRGQDTVLAGHRMANDVAVAQARRDQGNKDRQFSLDEDKYGTDVAQKNFEQRQAATTSLHNEIGNMIPPGPDGKPDLTTAARYATGLNALVGQHEQTLQAHLAQHPEDVQAKQNLQLIQQKGVGALDAGEKRNYVTGMRAKELAEENHSFFNPFGGTAVQSDAPVTSMRLKKGLITDDYVTNRGDAIPARAVDHPGSTFGLGGRRDTNYDSLKH